MTHWQGVTHLTPADRAWLVSVHGARSFTKDSIDPIITLGTPPQTSLICSGFFLNSFLIRTTNYWKLLRVWHYYLKHCLAKAGPRRKGMWLIFSPIFSYHDVSVKLGEAFPRGGDCHTLSEKNIRDILGEK